MASTSAPPTRARQARLRRRRRRRVGRLVARTLLVGLLALLVGAGTFVGGLLAAPIDLDVAPPPTPALLLADDGRQIATIEPPEKREDVKAEDIPQVMRDAIISAEDQRFLEHNGVDVLATMRAAFRDLTGTGVFQGGSTLTQQYVKNAYVDNDRTALRKIREAALAVRLEQRLSKQEIVTDYLNALYLGNGLYGVQAASKYYFGVPIKDLALNEHTGQRDPTLALARASMLAGIAPAPSAWNPVKDFTTARIRQQYTLNQMVVGGHATPQEVTTAYRHDVRPLRESPPAVPNDYPEFVDYVTDKVKKDPSYDEDTFFRGGIAVKTTLDLDLQQAFAQALREVLPDATDPQAALIAVDYTNGDIKAMATLRRAPDVVNINGKVVRKGVDGYQQRLGFNLSTAAKRASGSTIKTFTLAQALAEGKKLTDTRRGPKTDTIRCSGCPGGAYTYGNAGDGEGGRSYSLASALVHSINTVYVPLANEVGREKVAKLAEKAGLAPAGDLQGPCKKNSKGVVYYCPPARFLSFGIGGGVDVTPLGEALGYGTFANDGIHVNPRAFTEVRVGVKGTDEGRVLTKVPVSGRVRVVKSSVASDVVKTLTEVVKSGTATSVRLPVPVFGKTGTTNSSTDAWFTGCLPTEKICVASWMGYEYSACSVGKDKDNNPLRVAGPCGGMSNLHGVKQVYGGTLPAKAFTRAQQILEQIRADRKARAAGLVPAPTPTATPKATRAPSRAPVTPTTAAPAPTAAPTPRRTPSPTPTPTPTPTQAPTQTPPTVLPPGPGATESPPPPG